MKSIIIFLMLLFIISCKSRTEAEIYEESYLRPGTEGIVNRTELWKGGVLKIFIQNKSNKEEIVGVFNEYSILEQIQPKDYLKKIENSNKIFITRKDSILYFDSISLERLNKNAYDSLSNVEQWDRNIVNKWTVIE